MLSAAKQVKLKAFCIHCISPNFQAKARLYFQSTIPLVRIINVWERFGISYLRGVLGGGTVELKVFCQAPCIIYVDITKKMPMSRPVLVICGH